MIVPLLLIAFICCGFPGTLYCADTAVVDLKEAVVVEGAVVFLADLATIKGAGSSVLSSIPIMKSPGSPRSVTLSAKTVADKVHAAYQGPVDFKGASQVSISIRTIEVSRETLERTFIEEVLKQSPWKDSGRIEVSNVRVPRCPTVRDTGSLTIQAKFSPHEDFLGLVTANLIIGSGSSVERVTLSGRVRLFGDIPVARTKIRAGAMIASSDLVVKTMDLSESPRAFTKIEDCAGKRAKVTLMEGRPLLPSQVEQKPDVCTGEVVFIEVRVNNLVVRDKGLALKDGFQGEPIPVKNVASGKQVVGTIIAPSLVQVEL
jgi:flagella basal body P-ring formation protein FlgA